MVFRTIETQKFLIFLIDTIHQKINPKEMNRGVDEQKKIIAIELTDMIK